MFSEEKLRKLKNEIKTEAFNLGFSHIGFTTPEQPPHYDTFLQWVEMGFAADMQYLKREDTIAKRKNPNLILPDCKSIIVFALPYTPSSHQDNSNPKIASYALGSDYHHVIPRLLEKIIELIRTRINCDQLNFKIYTDTGPILERDFAQKAGLGWIGKNSCLITPDSGSYIFLSEILINLEFSSDPIFKFDHCGSCTRCIEACPTTCILPNRTIDSNKCISYLTIENRKAIPEEYREVMDSWIFGCDICQQVCPWNIRFAKTPEQNYFEILESIQSIDFTNALKMEKLQFKKEFENSPILRTKHNGLIRNFLIFANNNWQTQYVKPIIEFIDFSEDHELIELAKWVLNQNNINY
jgi:epoxyqueuosine reductase